MILFLYNGNMSRFLFFILIMSYSLRAGQIVPLNSFKLLLKNYETFQREITSVKEAEFQPILNFKSSSIESKKEISGEGDDLLIFDYLEVEKREEIKPRKNQVYTYDYTKKPVELCGKNQEQIPHNSQIKLGVDSIRMNRGSEELRNFELSYYDNEDEFLTSNELGEILIGNDIILNRERVGRQGRITAADHISLSVNFDFSHEKMDIIYPLFERYSFEKFLEEEKIDFRDAFILVQLDPSTEDLGISTSYRKKFYLDASFSKTDKKEAEFVLFAGVNTGNVEISVTSFKKDVFKTLVHLKTDEIYYFVYERGEGEKMVFTVCEKELFSSSENIFSISGGQLKLFNNDDLKAEKRTVNSYLFTRVGSRDYHKNYIIFSHLEQEIIASLNGYSHLELPSESYLNYILDGFKHSNRSCMVQINVSGDMALFDIEGYGEKDYFSYELSSLGKDGVFDQFISSKTKKIFIQGIGEGVFYSKITYKNESVDYLKSFCGPGTYVLEQL